MTQADVLFITIDCERPRWNEELATSLPQIWDVFGKRRVLAPNLSFAQQTLLLLYSSPESAVPMEDLVSWTEHSNAALYRRDVLRKLHKGRLVEYDRETEMVAISPNGVSKVEEELLPRA